MNEDMPWAIGLSDEEIQKLRTNKQQLTEYGREKIRKLMNENYIPDDDTIEEMLHTKLSEEKKEELARSREEENRPFYRFFAVDYFATGEGMSFWLKICRNYPSNNGYDYEMERFKEFIGCDHYYHGIEEPIEEEFRTKYANLIPDYVSKMLDKRDQPGFIWETHYHFNYS